MVASANSAALVQVSEIFPANSVVRLFCYYVSIKILFLFALFQEIDHDSAVTSADDETVSAVAARVFSKGFSLQQLLEFVRNKSE